MHARNAQRPVKKVLIVDDHPVMRAGLRQLIAQEEDLEVCAEAEDAHGALVQIDTHKPDVAVVDIALRESSGIELIKDIKIRQPELPILVLTMHEESFYAERVLRAGARGYVTKAEASTKIVEGLREVLRGGVYVSSKVASRMVTRLVGAGSDLGTFPVDGLSDREFEVFELLGQGLGTREIAGRLHVSVRTIDAHREHIKKKLNLDSANALLKYAVQWMQFEGGT